MWILHNGAWDDTGVWQDTNYWIDGPRTLIAVEAPDVAVITGSGVSPSGTLNATEAPDTAVINVRVDPIGILAATEARDVCVINGSVVAVPLGLLAAIEQADRAEIRISFTGSQQTGKVPYSSIWDYGWYNRHPPLRR